MNYAKKHTLICNNDSKIYHAKCLKIDRDTAYELQNTPDWFCPCYLEFIFPYFNHNFPSVTNNSITKCHSCKKIISKSRDHIVNCFIYDNISHASCISNTTNTCTSCTLYDISQIDLNDLFRMAKFNPYSVFDENDEENCNKNCIFDGDLDFDFCETTDIARNVLNKCKFYDSEDIAFENGRGASFYFNIYTQLCLIFLIHPHIKASNCTRNTMCTTNRIHQILP